MKTALSLLALLPFLLAARQDPVPDEGGPPAADAFELLVAEYEAAEEEWKEAIRAADRDERRALRKQSPTEDFWPRFEAVARGGEGRALLWMATHLREKGLSSREARPEKERLYAELFAQHVGAPWFGAVLEELPREERYLEDGRLPAYYRVAMEKGSTPDVRAQATYRLGVLLFHSPAPSEQAAGKALLERASTEHPGTRYGTLAAAEITKPIVGRPAPEFLASTIDGHEFRLSDYRGKVVLLDFYGFW